MNKLKKAIARFRAYLGRDTEGLRRLDEVTTIANEIRKERAALEAQLTNAEERIHHLRKEVCNVQAKAQEVTRKLEAETARRKGAEVREERLSVSLAEHRQEVERESAEMDTVERSLIDMPKFRRLFKAVRKRFPSGPPDPEEMRQVVILEKVVKSYDHDEFTSLGMLLAVLALHNFPATVKAARTFKDHGLPDKDMQRFISWYRRWILSSPTEQIVRGPCDSMLGQRTPFGLERVDPSGTIVNEREDPSNDHGHNQKTLAE